MVTTLIKLRFLLLAGSLRRNVWHLVGAILGGLYGLGILGTGVAGLFALSFAPLELAGTVITLVGAVLTLGWMLGPLLTSGIDQTLDPLRLATFPIPRGQLLVALAVSGVLGIPGIVTSIVALATAATWWQHPVAAVVALVCAVIGVLICVVGSRMIVALATRLSSGRRAREAKSTLLIIPLVLLGPIIIGVGNLVGTYTSDFPAIANVVAWTPIGAIWAVPSNVASGEFLAAALRFLIGVATLVGMSVIWRWALARALELPARASAAGTAHGLGLFGVFPATPWGAVAARALTYWIRDPRYAQSLIVIPLIPVLIFFYSNLSGSTNWLNVVGPIVAAVVAISTFVDVSYDNTAFALHVQTGVSGRDDRLGRIIALALFAVPVSLLLTVGTVWFTGAWSQLPGWLALTIGALLAGFAWSSLVSGAIIVPVPAPGQSPFATPPGGGMRVFVLTFASWAVLAVLIAPELVLAITSFVSGEAIWGWAALAVAGVLGSVLLWLGIRVGGKILDARVPELLAKLVAYR